MTPTLDELTLAPAPAPVPAAEALADPPPMRALITLRALVKEEPLPVRAAVIVAPLLASIALVMPAMVPAVFR